MAFDFNHDQTTFKPLNNGSPSGGGFDWSNPGGSSSGSSFDSGFSNSTAGLDSGGFNMPSNDPFSLSSDPFQTSNATAQVPVRPPTDNGTNRTRMNYAKPQRSRRPTRGPVQLPWNYIIPGSLIVALIVLCIIFRDAITDFLAQILTWAIVILVVYIIIRIIFGRRRRRW